MKTRLFLAALSVAGALLVSCEKGENQKTIVAEGPVMALSISQGGYSRAFMDGETAGFEKKITELSFAVFDSATKGCIIQREFSQEEIAAGKALFSLPKYMAGKQICVYAWANTLSFSDGKSAGALTSEADVVNALDNTNADLNAYSYEEITGDCQREEGFVMSAREAVTVPEAGANVSLTLKRTAFKMSVKTLLSQKFLDNHKGTLLLGEATLSGVATHTPVWDFQTYTERTPESYAGSFTDEFSQESFYSESDKWYENIFYVNPMKESTKYLTLTLTATYDIDGKPSTTADRGTVIYEVPLHGEGGANGAEFLPNKCYHVTVILNGLTGSDCSASITVAPWDTVVDENVELGN